MFGKKFYRGRTPPKIQKYPQNTAFTRTFSNSSRGLLPVSLCHVERKQEGGFAKGRFWRMCPRSGFWHRGTSTCTLVRVFGTWEHPHVPSFRFSVSGSICQNHPFGNHPLVNPRTCQEPSRNCSEKLVQMKFLIFGGSLGGGGIFLLWRRERDGGCRGRLGIGCWGVGRVKKKSGHAECGQTFVYEETLRKGGGG